VLFLGQGFEEIGVCLPHSFCFSWLNIDYDEALGDCGATKKQEQGLLSVPGGAASIKLQYQL
jgi:hypothetical protein